MASRLNQSVLEELKESVVSTPSYSRERLDIGQMHLGIGAFHRAHQAVYTDHVLNQGDCRWGISAVSLRRPLARDQLQPQDYLFSVVARQGADQETRIVGAVQEVLVAPENPEAVLARLADEKLHVVTLTITEKAYRETEADSAIDYLCRGLSARRRKGLQGLTILSCDNLGGNGALLKTAVLKLAEAEDSGLADWIDEQCRFPSTMVDRIVPATTEHAIAELEQCCHYRDEAMVEAEAFSQWVIEKRFAGPMPDWEAAGALLVDDVLPYETMKLRLLNASHSAIAYLGCLAGWETVASAIDDPDMHDFVKTMMASEVTPILDVPDGFDATAYQQQLLQRFANTALQHRTEQIAMDGSQKLPQRILPSLVLCLQQGVPAPRLLLVVAAWIVYAMNNTVEDPLTAELAEVASHGGPEQWVTQLLQWQHLFPQALSQLDGFKQSLTDQVINIHRQGVRACLKALA